MNFTHTYEASRERCNGISRTGGTIKCRVPHTGAKVSFILWLGCPQYAVLDELYSSRKRTKRCSEKKTGKKTEFPHTSVASGDSK